MRDYEIIGWPDIQAYMELEGFEENSTRSEEHTSELQSRI